MKSQAAVFFGQGQPLKIVEIDIAEPGPTDVLVRMAAVGICGTDLHQIKGDWHRPTPMVLGHEGSGVIEAVGREVPPQRVGERVVLAWASSCGNCPDCLRGRPAACSALHAAFGAGTLVDGTTGMSLNGKTVHRGTATGALSKRLVVDQRVALPIGDDLPLDQAAMLGCAALTGVGAVLFAVDPAPASTMLVIGAGGVGQFCVQGAGIAAASVVICVDPIAARRESAIKLGATYACHPDELGKALDIAAPNGVDYAFDAVGHPDTTSLALRCVRSGGTAIVVGLTAAGEELRLDPAEFVRREKRLTGTMYGSIEPAQGITTLLEHVRAGRLDLARLVTARYPLELVNDAVNASLDGTPGRVVVTL